MADLRTAFATIEQGWANHQAKLQTVENVHGVTQGELGSIKQEIINTKAELAATIENTRNRLLEVNNNSTAMGDAVRALQNSGVASAPSSGGGNRKMDQLINPQNMVVETFEEKDKAKFSKWRKRVMTLLDIYFDDISHVMKAVRGHNGFLDEGTVHRACQAKGITVLWNFEKADKEIATYLTGKLGVGPLELAETAGEHGFEMMRLLTQRYDPIGVQTQAKLVNRITNLINAPGPAKTFAETQDRITLLDRFVKDYEERLEKKPSPEIVSSTFTNLVDPSTKKTFVERAILDNYEAMRTLLNDLASQLLHQTASPMDIGQCSIKEPTVEPVTDAPLLTQPHSYAAAAQQWTGTQAGQWSDPWAGQGVYDQPTLDALKGKGKGKTGKGDGSCNICKQHGHWARECPQNPNKGKGKGFKGYKGGGFQNKGKGKGKAYEFTATAPNQWYGDWPQEQWPGDNNGGWAQQPGGPVPLSAVVRKDVREDITEEVSTNNRYDALDDEAAPYDEEFPALSIDDAPAQPYVAHTSMVNDPVYQTIPGTAHLVQEMMRQNKIREAENLAILNGTKKRGKDDPEWVKARARLQEMRDHDSLPPLPPPALPPPAPAPEARPIKKERRKYRILDEEHKRSACVDKHCTDAECWTKVSYAKNSNRPKDMSKSPCNPLQVLIAKQQVLSPAVEKPKWEPLTFMVDSGASDTVMSPTQVPTAKLKPSAGSSVGLEYEVANGESIKNLGEKTLSVVPHGGQNLRALKVQCADVHRGLLSVAQCVDNGNTVVFDRSGSYILDNQTGEKTLMVREGNIFNLRVWAKPAEDGGQSSFAGPGK